mmetsp:Transcript_69147/g.122092  ORF Transcript_69147/g.122092 Transcript_69147/m.122092 type:complete len:270 (+) Transcript_69147:2601-3410(+)
MVLPDREGSMLRVSCSTVGVVGMGDDVNPMSVLVSVGDGLRVKACVGLSVLVPVAVGGGSTDSDGVEVTVSVSGSSSEVDSVGLMERVGAGLQEHVTEALAVSGIRGLGVPLTLPVGVGAAVAVGLGDAGDCVTKQEAVQDSVLASVGVGRSVGDRELDKLRVRLGSVDSVRDLEAGEGVGSDVLLSVGVLSPVAEADNVQEMVPTVDRVRLRDCGLCVAVACTAAVSVRVCDRDCSTCTVGDESVGVSVRVPLALGTVVVVFVRVRVR